ncbi:hypothetical protein F4680DRAFT_427886 [Xylaria scruposa]|nr:hypothetical protein F4680DRAFT_427886 [Xylaria scruposa]
MLCQVISTNSGSGYASSDYSTVTREIFRSQKSENHQGERVERDSHGKRSVTYNHNARGYEKDAPHPPYGRSQARQ